MEDKFSDYIRKVRINKEVTLRQVAKETGLGVTQLHYIERGKVARPKMEELRTLAAYYGLPEDDVILKGGRLPSDIYFRIIKHPELIQIIRNHSSQ